VTHFSKACLLLLSPNFDLHSGDEIATIAGYTQKNGAVSEVIETFISHPTRVLYIISAEGSVQVSQALTAVHFLCLLQGRGTSFQNGVATRKGFLCAPF
jgi:hypothetical protein